MTQRAAIFENLTRHVDFPISPRLPGFEFHVNLKLSRLKASQNCGRIKIKFGEIIGMWQNQRSVEGSKARTY